MEFHRIEWVSPLPRIYWNHRASVNFRNNPTGTIACGQNLENMGVKPIVTSARRTAFALTMIG
jgi:hypothetical protein